MAMEIDPERGDPIQVTAAVGVFQIDATAPFNDKGPLVLPLTLLGEGMPEVAVTLRLKPRGAGRGSHEEAPVQGGESSFTICGKSTIISELRSSKGPPLCRH